MKTPRSSAWRLLSPAPLAAGLLLFSALLRADNGPPPGRDVAPTAVSSPAGAATPSTRTAAAVQAIKASVEALDQRRKEQERGLREAERRLDAVELQLREQAERLSRSAQALGSLSASSSADASSRERLDAALEGLRQRVDALETRAQGLDEARAKSDVLAAAEGTHIEVLEKGFAEVKRDLDQDQDKLAAGLKDLDATRGSMAKLDAMHELMTMMKKDIETDDEELVEVKQSLKRLEPAAPAEGSENLLWWDGLASWKYLPAVATGVSVVALGVAALRH